MASICRSSSVMDSAMGSIIRVVAALLIHMLSSAEASMKPARMERGFDPERPKMPRAMRRCNPQRCMAKESKKPPMNK